MSKIQIDNFDDFKSIVEKAKFKTEKYGEVVIFTNGNEWYVPTLIHNLVKSMKIHEPNKKIIVFCSDTGASDKCKELGFELFKFINIPDLHVSNITKDSNAGTDNYTRLCFFKTVLIRQILELGYTPLYIDPDMSFIKPAIDNLLSHLEFEDFVCAGVPDYINSNLMISQPSPENLKLFHLTVDDVENIIESKSKNGDEDLLRPRLKSLQFVCVSTKEYPPGCDAEKYLKVARMIHSNCVIGLENKIDLMKRCKAWFLEEDEVKEEQREHNFLISKEFTSSLLNVFPPLLKGDIIEKYLQIVMVLWKLL